MPDEHNTSGLPEEIAPGPCGESAPPPPDSNSSPLAPPEPPGLPWERQQGFLWGFPATVWLLLRHPFKAYATQPAAGVMEPLAFSAIMQLFRGVFISIMLISWLGVKFLCQGFFDNPSKVGVFCDIVLYLLKEIFAKQLFSAIGQWVLHLIWALFCWMTSRLFFKKRPQWLQYYRAIAYGQVGTIFLLIPYVGNFLDHCWTGFSLVYSFSNTTHSSRLLSLLNYLLAYCIIIATVAIFSLIFGFWDLCRDGFIGSIDVFFVPASLNLTR